MNRKDFLQLLDEKILVLDGAYGTQISAIIDRVAFPEQANILSPDTVLNLHRNYIDAGADIIKTNTFGIFHLFKSGKINYQQALELIRSGAIIGKKAVRDKNVLCFASFGPMSDSIFEYSSSTIDFFENFYGEAAKVVLENGVDGILLETFSDFLEIKIAINSIREVSESVPIVAQFTLNSHGNTIQGGNALNCGAYLETIDCDVAGLNCSTGPVDMVKNFKIFSSYISKPLSVSPNAGLPEFKNGKVVYIDLREQFANATKQFIEQGARIVGSCCGSTPEYTKILKECVENFRIERKSKKKDFLVSRDYLFDFDKISFLPVGERLNLMGNRTFKNNYLKDFQNAIEIEVNRQLTAGAQCLDLNVDLYAKDNPEIAKRDIFTLQNISKCIISIDTLYIDLMKRFALYSACSPIYNSADLTEKRFKAVAELYKRYGGKIVVLLMSGNRIPKTINERIKGIEVLDKLVKRFGIRKEDVFVDPLALTLATGIENYKYVEEIIEKSDYKTFLGLSNFSHGLPDRSRLNAFLLTNLMRKGLNASILDVSDPDIASVLFNFKAIFEEKGFFNLKENAVKFHGEFAKWGDYLLNGEDEKLIEEIIFRIKKGDKPFYLLETGLVSNMEHIGSFFEKGLIYLPQLLVAADTMKKAFEALRPFLEEDANKDSGAVKEEKGRILLFTVQNDIHDIGKNIVLTVLKSFGFSVFDGGIDKSPEDILEAINSSNARVVGLSALMTTSLPYMKETVKIIKERMPHIKVIVGGAVVTKKFAEEIGADGYGKNAFDAVNLVRSLL